MSATAVLVWIEPKKLTIKQRPADIDVVTERQLLRWLQCRCRRELWSLSIPLGDGVALLAFGPDLLAAVLNAL